MLNQSDDLALKILVACIASRKHPKTFSLLTKWLHCEPIVFCRDTNKHLNPDRVICSDLIKEITQCLPSTISSTSLYLMWEYSRIIAEIPLQIQEAMAIVLGESQTMKDQLTTGFANFPTVQCSHSIAAQESFSSIDYEQPTKQKNLSSPKSPLPTGISSEKLSNLLLRIRQNQK